jgi:hypothetical protein
LDVLLLGAAAIVLIAITVWIVWPAPNAAAPSGTDLAADSSDMLPLGDEFEDQHTSATADLSAGSMATAMAGESHLSGAAASRVVPTPTAFQAAAEPWSSPTLAREGALPAQRPARVAKSPTVSIAAAVLLTLGGAIAGAWLYARWQRQRNKPVSRRRRRLLR